MTYEKKCPDCGKVLTYKRKNALVWSIRHNCKCSSCAKIGKMNSTVEWRNNISKALKGHKKSEEWKQKLSDANKGHKDSKETRKKKSLASRGKNNSFYGKAHTSETKTKLRIKFYERMAEKYGGKGACPMYNPRACAILDEYGSKNGYKLQHALNGGEFYIKELGYWVDGYDEEKNVVVEYNEPYHNRKNMKHKDRERLNQIKKILGCKIIILKETKNSYKEIKYVK